MGIGPNPMMEPDVPEPGIELPDGVPSEAGEDVIDDVEDMGED